MSLWPGEASAQRRGRPVRGGGRVVVGAPLYFGYGYGFYDPFFWGWGWGPGWGPGWGFPGMYPPFGGAWGGMAGGSARLQITPKQAEVYVDGYLAGSVDDFDGFFQRLDVAPGEHELTIWLEGYETITQKVLFQPGETLDIRQRMTPLAPGATSGPRPTAAMPPADPVPGAGPMRGPRGPRPPVDDAPPPQSNFGTLSVRIQPADATLLVDGEEWAAPEGDGPILIDLPEGTHDIEVRRDGLPAYRRTVQIRAGRTLPLNVSLSR